MSESPAAAPVAAAAPAANVPVTETPEFQMALAAATAEISAKLLTQVQEVMKGSPKTPNDDGAMSLARMIATSIAEVANQGTGRKTVPPEVMEARRNGHLKMVKLLEEARSLPANERPKYRLVTHCYFKDRLVAPFHSDPHNLKNMVPTDVYFMSSPNLGMKPINKASKEIYKAFLASISNNTDSEVPFTVKPMWVTDNGVIIAGAPPKSAEAHGRSLALDDAIDIDALSGAPPAVGHGEQSDDDPDFAIVGQNDPNLAEIAVLGTIAPKAQRTTSSPRRL